ncbi:phosphoribosyl-AMP cyclohydrolase [Zooshikella ganghwensis]|uniref:phosphoribosyl-AMP cyclohydrolase n=1 Tax=Zooshikella ganghwensis TaxID=202772 RepID=UPI0004210CCE|nr:phosphoribosyl-AMP cyclohydrolase [Zooshikella ganghwensis]
MINTNRNHDDWLSTIKWDANGLIPAIAQDASTDQILMMAWMNKAALQQTVEVGEAVYWSRSRQKLWHKGEQSGHTQQVHSIFLDCDSDVIILKVTQQGGIACHTGRLSCFYRQLDTSQKAPQWQTVAPVLQDPEVIYSKK